MKTLETIDGKSSNSSLMLYIVYKYLPVYLLVLMFLSMVKEYFYHDHLLVNNFVSIVKFISFFGFLQAVNLFLIFRAKINKEEIKLSKSIVIPWSKVKSVHRVGTIYFLTVKKSWRFYIFPAEKNPFYALGERISDTDMDQIITLKTSK